MSFIHTLSIKSYAVCNTTRTFYYKTIAYFLIMAMGQAQKQMNDKTKGDGDVSGITDNRFVLSR